MNHFRKDGGKCTKKNAAFSLRKWLWKRRFAIVAVVLFVFFVFTLPDRFFSWFYFQRSLQTVTRINAPNALIIGAGNAYDIRELEISNIDVTGEQKYKDVVFCVLSAKLSSYHLQLAHTTNIDFQYSIYPAEIVLSESATTEGKTIVTYLEDSYSLDLGKLLEGAYLNKATDNNYALTEGNYHNKTYAKSSDSTEHYDEVQFQAEPLYWKTTQLLDFTSEQKKDGYYINYYVLRISWNEGIENNKETDMVYLMAEVSGSGT